MKRLIPAFGLLILLVWTGWGCSDKKAEDDTKVPLEVKKAESMDSTRLDSALVDTTVTDSAFLDTSGR